MVTKQDLKATEDSIRKDIQQDMKSLEENIRRDMVTKGDLEKSQEVLRRDMVTKGDLEKSQEVLRRDMVTKGDLEKSLKDLRREIKNDIDASQEDTITVLTEVINTSYQMTDKRITIIEEHLGLETKHQN